MIPNGCLWVCNVDKSYRLQVKGTKDMPARTINGVLYPAVGPEVRILFTVNCPVLTMNQRVGAGCMLKLG